MELGEQPFAGQPARQGVQEVHRDGGEDEVVDDALDQRHPLEGAERPRAYGVAQGHGQHRNGGDHDDEAQTTRGHAHRPQPPLGLERVVGDLTGHQGQVARDPAQPAVGEAGRDPVLELDDHLLHGRRARPLQPVRSAHGQRSASPACH